MFFLNTTNVWSFSFFMVFTYTTLFFLFLVYILPLLLASNNTNNNVNKFKFYFYMISGSEALTFFMIPLIYILLINNFWSSASLTVWFGHLVFCSFQSKLIIISIFMFYIVLYSFLSTTYLSSNDIYDFVITKINFFY